MRCHIIESERELCNVAGEWARLVHSLPEATPFQLPLWLLNWWRHFGSGKLQVLTLWEGELLNAVVPLFQHEWQGRKQLTLMGSGVSDWTDPALASDGLPTIQAYLTSNPEWEVLDWQDLNADSPLRCIAGVIVRDDVPCSEARLTGTFEQFWNSRSKELRRNLRRYGQRAAENGRVELEVSGEAEPELLNQLIRLHGARWQKQGESGMIAANRSESFLRDVAEQLARQNMLRIFTLRWRGTVAAIVLTMLFRNRIFAYMSAFDPEHESLGFGRMLLYESFRHCFAHGYTAWNFLRGAESYKASWGGVAVAKIRLYKER